MRRALSVLVAAAVVVAILAGAWWAFLTSESTDCFTGFKSHEAAERAADQARALWIDVEVEQPGPDARRPTSIGARQVSVVFTSGETGDGAAEFRAAVRNIAQREGASGKPVVGCSEREVGTT
jgi:hypothetical protein